jgi:protein transport protein SEC24
MAARDGDKLTHELRHALVRPTAWEAVMRIRCSKGLRIASFHGHFFNRQACVQSHAYALRCIG